MLPETYKALCTITEHYGLESQSATLSLLIAQARLDITKEQKGNQK
jgi:hypothetical protein